MGRSSHGDHMGGPLGSESRVETAAAGEGGQREEPHPDRGLRTRVGRAPWTGLEGQTETHPALCPWRATDL